MWQKILAMSLVMIMVLPFTACDKEPSVEEVLDGIIAAADDITTLSYDMNAEMNVEIEGYLAGMDMQTDGESMNINASMTSGGVIDKENEQLQMDADISYGITGVEDSVSGMSYQMAIAIYLLDNTGYIMMDTPMMGVTWQKYSLSAEEMQQFEEIFGGQDSIVNPQMVLEMAEITIEGSEKIGGVDCYRLKLEMDTEKIWQKIEEMAQEAGEAIPEEFEREILDKIIDGISMKMWVAKDTYYIAKMQMLIDIELNAEDFGDIEEDMQAVKINASYDMLMYDYNEPVTITLPPEAEEAVETPMYNSEEEEMDLEYHNIQIGVAAMMIDANVTQLISSYDEVDTLAEVQEVTAKTGYTLDKYIYGDYPLKQAYDIALDGEVTVD